MSTNNFPSHRLSEGIDAITRHNDNRRASSVPSLEPDITSGDHQPPITQYHLPISPDSDASEDASRSSHSIRDEDDDTIIENESDGHASEDANESVEIVSGGFDTDWFVLSASELHDLDVVCPICTKVLQNTVFSNIICQHEFCMSCLARWHLQAQSCPSCRQKSSLNTIVQSRKTRSRIEDLEVRCRNDRRCGAIGKLGANGLFWEKHETSCKFERAQCLQCDDEVCRYEMEEHCRTKCRRRSLLCEYCNSPYPAEDMKDHIQHHCGSVLLECSQKCGAEALSRTELQTHLEDTCPLRMLECPFRLHGCEDHQHQRRNLHKHLSTAMPRHLELVANSAARAGKALQLAQLRNSRLEQRFDALASKFASRIASDAAEASVKCGCQSGCGDAQRCLCTAAGKTCSMRCSCSGACRNPDASAMVLQVRKQLQELQNRLMYRSRDEFLSCRAWREYMNNVLELGMLVRARYHYSSLTGRVSVNEGELGEVTAIQHGRVKITWNGNGTLWHQMQDEFFEPAELRVFGRRTLKRRRPEQSSSNELQQQPPENVRQNHRGS